MRHLATALVLLWPATRVYAPVFVPIRIVDARTVPQMLDAAAERHGISSELLRHRAWAESRFDAAANSGRGDFGVMQLNARYFPTAETMSTYENIEAGAAYLAQLLQRCEGDEPCAERAYRTGKIRQ